MLADEEARPVEYHWRENLTIPEGKNIAVKTGTSTKRVDGELYPVDNLVVGYSPKATILLWAGNTDGEHLKPYSVAVITIGALWIDIGEKFFEKYPEKHETFVAQEPMQKIHGEWATMDYNPPDYVPLAKNLVYSQEWNLNPFVKLK
jgi:membrane peptidoglycan carboxypeptidase